MAAIAFSLSVLGEFGIVQANNMHLSIPQQAKVRQNRYTLTAQNVAFSEFWKLYASHRTVMRMLLFRFAFTFSAAQVMSTPMLLQCMGKINLLDFEPANESEILEAYITIGEKFIMRQFRIQNESKAVAEFFEILQQLFDANQIQEEIHLRFSGESILLNFQKLYNLFMQNIDRFISNLHLIGIPYSQSLLHLSENLTGNHLQKASDLPQMPPQIQSPVRSLKTAHVS